MKLFGKLTAMGGTDRDKPVVPQVIHLTSPSTFIGRFAQPIPNAEQFSHSTQSVIACLYVSSTHFSITEENDKYTVRDFARNGTYLNDVLIGADPKEIKEGDCISLKFKGSTTLIYKFELLTEEEKVQKISEMSHANANISDKKNAGGVKGNEDHAADHNTANSLTSQIKIMQDEIRKLEAKRDSLTQELEIANKQVESSMRKSRQDEKLIESLSKEVAELNDRIKGTEEHHITIQARSKILEEELDDLKQDLKEAKGKIASLREDITERSEQTKTIRGLLEESNKALADEESHRVFFESKSKAMEAEILEWQLKHSRLVAANQALQRVVEQSDREKQLMSDQLQVQRQLLVSSLRQSTAIVGYNSQTASKIADLSMAVNWLKEYFNDVVAQSSAALVSEVEDYLNSKQDSTLIESSAPQVGPNRPDNSEPYHFLSPIRSGGAMPHPTSEIRSFPLTNHHHHNLQFTQVNFSQGDQETGIEVDEEDDSKEPSDRIKPLHEEATGHGAAPDAGYFSEDHIPPQQGTTPAPRHTQAANEPLPAGTLLLPTPMIEGFNFMEPPYEKESSQFNKLSAPNPPLLLSQDSHVQRSDISMITSPSKSSKVSSSNKSSSAGKPSAAEAAEAEVPFSLLPSQGHNRLVAPTNQPQDAMVMTVDLEHPSGEKDQEGLGEFSGRKKRALFEDDPLDDKKEEEKEKEKKDDENQQVHKDLSEDNSDFYFTEEPVFEPNGKKPRLLSSQPEALQSALIVGKENSQPTSQNIHSSSHSASPETKPKGDAMIMSPASQSADSTSAGVSKAASSSFPNINIAVDALVGMENEIEEERQRTFDEDIASISASAQE